GADTFVLLHRPPARSELALKVIPSAGLREAHETQGGLDLLDAANSARLRLETPSAIDKNGQRVQSSFRSTCERTCRAVVGWSAHAVASPILLRTTWRATSAAPEIASDVLAPLVTTDRSTYATTDTALVRYTRLSGSGADWIALALPGSSPTSFIRYA